MEDELKISLVTTVLNEADSIIPFFSSILGQTRPPNEIVVVDGGSDDGTIELLRQFEGPGTKVEISPGANISLGRNIAVGLASHPIIACTDAGTRLDPDWLAQLIAPFTGSNPPEVVCGFFVADPASVYERALGAATLPVWSDINPIGFLPSSRSVAFTKDAWKKVGGYPEWIDYCEDVIFDLQLRQAGISFGYAPGATAHFRPRPNLVKFFHQYYRYARGDGKANLWPRRHLIRYLVYAITPIFVVAVYWYNFLWLLLLLGAGVYCYRPYRRLAPWLSGLSWSQKIKAVLWIPITLLTGDVAKMLGYPAGCWWRRNNKPPLWAKDGA